MKEIARLVFSTLGYQIKRTTIEPDHMIVAGRLSAYPAAVLGLAASGNFIRIVIVGANDGRINDPIHETVRAHLAGRSEIVLFEPQHRLHPMLRETYAFHPACTISGAAIGPQGTLELHAIRPEFWSRARAPYAAGWPDYRAPTGVTSGQREHVVAWANQHIRGLRDAEKAVERLSVPCKPLPAALRDLGLSVAIDVLQVDAEGADDTVLYNAGLAETRPAVIHFEFGHLTADRGNRLLRFLDSLGYVVWPLGQDRLAVRASS
ncbi:FkbM family methyltransferase [Pararhodobacter sp. SW119]|uniref:FkbM family methyltransferase n=1 Tax=Pararhodobacter sp. SW119 TaxID=2780075 RepID=UPI001ADF4076|nr:FkbM family methyltransferase [Pararhodobacter sp. SW119]